MTGISDGFIVDDRGQIVQLYDPTIALSCAFGYKIQTESTETSNRLDVEIERRQLDFSQLLQTVGLLATTIEVSRDRSKREAC